MNEAVTHLHCGGPLLALVGNPDCGKTALFNRRPGSRQKVADDAGVTVERKEGRLASAAGKALRLLDMPGTHSLHPRSHDERLTHDVLHGQACPTNRPLTLCPRPARRTTPPCKASCSAWAWPRPCRTKPAPASTASCCTRCWARCC